MPVTKPDDGDDDDGYTLFAFGHLPILFMWWLIDCVYFSHCQIELLCEFENVKLISLVELVKKINLVANEMIRKTLLFSSRIALIIRPIIDFWMIEDARCQIISKYKFNT